MKDFEEQLKVILRGTAEVIPKDELQKRLEESIRLEKPLRVKLGIDPTAPDIHLGHTIVLRKLRQFQDLGHKAVLIIGDYTALVGDPSGREKTRPKLSSEQVEENARTYLEQVGKVLDLENLEIVRNSQWFSEFTFKDVLDLTSRMTVARLLERDEFSRRYSAEIPISLHEFLYPLMQAYDSVMVKSDIEIGATEQTFNLLVGRNLQKEEGLPPQVALTMPILIGTDGSQKMSKSLGNFIAISESPAQMYGKIMSIPDELMRDYFELLTDVPEDEIEALLSDRTHPKEAKKRLAREIVSTYHGSQAALKEERNFEKVFARKELPEQVPDVHIPRAFLKDGKIWIVRLLLSAGMASSSSEARRLVAQGAVLLGSNRIMDSEASVTIAPGSILKVGKRKFARLFPEE